MTSNRNQISSLLPEVLLVASKTRIDDPRFSCSSKSQFFKTRKSEAGSRENGWIFEIFIIYKNRKIFTIDVYVLLSTHEEKENHYIHICVRTHNTS